jgi:spermidine synthase
VWEKLPTRARDLETELALPFTRVVDKLQRSKPA